MKQIVDATLNMQIPISLFILDPENPNDSQSHEGRALNVSQQGMQVQIDGMDEVSYEILSARLCRVRVSLRTKIKGQQIQVPGFVAWHAYHEAKGSGEPACCKMGIMLDMQDNVEIALYSDFLNGLIPS